MLVLVGFVSAQPVVWAATHQGRVDDDAACVGVDGPAVVGAHHQAGVQIETPLPTSPVDHCTFCHLHRAFGGVRPTGSVIVAPRDARRAASATECLAPASVAPRHFDSRGPPLVLS